MEIPDSVLEQLIGQTGLTWYQVVLISAGVSLLMLIITSWLKNIFENRLLHRKLETEHAFDQRKKIKEVLAKNKVHLLTACEELNYRFWNYADHHQEKWLEVNGHYHTELYYFHSFCYRILAVFAWIKVINREMVYLDTTIATKEDMEFIKFLRVFPENFVDLDFLIGKGADGSFAVDHFFKNRFEQFSDRILHKDGVHSYSEFISDLHKHQAPLAAFFEFMDGVSPNEARTRWDRLHAMHLTVILFLNNFGYDFHRTPMDKLQAAIQKQKTSKFLKTYFDLLESYLLRDNREAKKLEKFVKEVLGA